MTGTRLHDVVQGPGEEHPVRTRECEASNQVSTSPAAACMAVPPVLVDNQAIRMPASMDFTQPTQKMKSKPSNKKFINSRNSWSK